MVYDAGSACAGGSVVQRVDVFGRQWPHIDADHTAGAGLPAGGDPIWEKGSLTSV